MIELQDAVLAIAKTYMGIAADEYLKRRCTVSLQLATPGELRPEHLERLAEAVEMTAEVYLSQPKVKQFKEELLQLKRQYS
jgi:hypothetical protein